MENPPCDPLKRAAQEVLSVGLGFGILGVQRFQVKRREWERSSGHSVPSPSEYAQRFSSALGGLSSIITEFGRR